ncbi:ABC transporter substrate-binding protein [Bacillota bacterium Meth-B3]
MKKLFCLMFTLLLATANALAMPAEDRAGNPLDLKAAPARVISLAPATTQVIVELGLKDRLVAVDTYSPSQAEGVSELPQFDMMHPDCEAMAELAPDLVLVSAMSYEGGGDPFTALRTLGITVAVIPSSDSVAGVAEDVRFIARIMGAEESGEALTRGMLDTVEAVRAIGEAIPEAERKSVMFEIGALPYLYSFGSGTFLNELIELMGARNVFADQQDWISVSEESAVEANPDVILTSVSYIDDAVGEILGRAGWGEVSAIKGGQVFYIDNTASSLPNHHIADALVEMARRVYPDRYAAFDAPLLNEDAA